jgi:uncharacterized protein with GYD domain
MATYIELLRFTDKGIRNVRLTTERAEAFKAAVAEHMDVTIKEIYWTQGSYDLVMIMDAPNGSVTCLSRNVNVVGACFRYNAGVHERRCRCT